MTSPVRVGLALLSLPVVLLSGCGVIPNPAPTPGGSASASAGSSPSAGSAAGSASGGSTPAAGGDTCEYVATGQASKPVNPPSATGIPTSGTVKYVLKMTNGDVVLTLDRSKAPCTVHSFESLADQGFFNDTKCHRLADSGILILQCGDPTGTGSGGPGYQFADETDGTEKYTAGVVAMANAGPNTNGSQFFLVWGDSSSLGSNYTIFGRMDKNGRDVVASMAAEGQDGSYGDGTGRPNNPSAITSVTRG